MRFRAFLQSERGCKKPLRFYVLYFVISFGMSELFLSRKFFSIAGTAKNRTVVVRLKRHLCFASAFGADSRIKPSFGSACLFACHAACFTCFGLVCESFFCIKFLLTGGEHKFLTAVFAYKCLVFVHSATSLEKKYLPPRGTPASGHISKTDCQSDFVS